MYIICTSQFASRNGVSGLENAKERELMRNFGRRTRCGGGECLVRSVENKNEKWRELLPKRKYSARKYR